MIMYTAQQLKLESGKKKSNMAAMPSGHFESDITKNQ